MYNIKYSYILLISLVIGTYSCNKKEVISTETNYPQSAADINTNGTAIPENYKFERNGQSTVSYSGQVTRLNQANAIGNSLKDKSTQMSELQENFSNGEGFAEAALNGTGKNIRSKVANSIGYYANGATTASDEAKSLMDSYLSKQVSEVFPSYGKVASQGQAGVADGNRYVNAQGMEYNQLFMKSLIGALVVDQALNHYLNRLDDNYDGSLTWRKENDNQTPAKEGVEYTTMEHFWDEAYGYVYGLDASADQLLQKYINKVNGDSDFEGIASDIYKSFVIGRAAIADRNYDTRDQAIQVLRYAISKVVGVRAVNYLQSGKRLISSGREKAFHDLSEGYGFVYSLQFTHNPETGMPYLSQEEVSNMLATLSAGGGFWTVSESDLDQISETIASRFDFTVAQAAE